MESHPAGIGDTGSKQVITWQVMESMVVSRSLSVSLTENNNLAGDGVDGGVEVSLSVSLSQRVITWQVMESMVVSRSMSMEAGNNGFAR